jgi:NAD(P)-dependent dehydrogenase (short-subunit alcohol dehydrogenase family)
MRPLPELLDLHGKVAVVTGGSRGIGRAVAEGLATAGADVVIASRKLDRCEQAAREIEAATGLPVELWDERLTTVTADRGLQALDLDARARRRVVDKVAAAVMLQAWLDHRRLAGDRSPAPEEQDR